MCLWCLFKQGCELHAVAQSYGAIAASQRSSPSDDSGFSFTDCKVTGSGLVYLGRAWGRYARVVYSFCQIDGIILPQGWDDWGDPSRRGYELRCRYWIVWIQSLCRKLIRCSFAGQCGLESLRTWGAAPIWANGFHGQHHLKMMKLSLSSIKITSTVISGWSCRVYFHV